MNILVLNAGSSSLKYQLISMPSTEVKCVGLVERIGMDDAIFTHKKQAIKHSVTCPIKDHSVALKMVEEALRSTEYGVIENTDDIHAVGHRVVHGGSKFTETVFATDAVKANIKDLFDLAPLHNPANLTGIEVAESIFTNAKQTVVFDTAFHQTMPQHAYQYAIPKEYLEKHKIRAYGFHGTSHKYVAEKAAEIIGTDKNIITIHLGNGCSMSAVKKGKCIDTSLGLGPTSGLVMGTRAGDVDLSVVINLQTKFGLSAEEVNHILQKESGMTGLTGHSDLRDIQEKAAAGDKDCANALEIAAYRVKKYIGAYTAAMNGLDAIIFTAGIGENSSLMRAMSCREMEGMGIELDPQKNDERSSDAREIQSQNSRVKILVIPTNEELEIAKQTYRLMQAH